MASFVLALQMLTRVPVPTRPAAAFAELGHAIVWFPLVGALIGLVLATLDQTASRLFSPPVPSAVDVLAIIGITGAFHLDGLIDAVDGLSAGPDAPARLAAMRQRVAGNPGALAGIGLVLATFAAIENLPSDIRFVALVLAPTCARGAILLGYTLFPYGRSEQGLSLALKAGATPSRAVAGLSVAVAITLATAQQTGLVLVAGALLGGVGLGLLALQRLPGLTGDVHGAICEVVQLGVLLAAPAVLAR